MKISELIDVLTQIKEEHGNSSVYIDKNKYQLGKEVEVYFCSALEELEEHVHLRPRYDGYEDF